MSLNTLYSLAFALPVLSAWNASSLCPPIHMAQLACHLCGRLAWDTLPASMCLSLGELSTPSLVLAAFGWKVFLHFHYYFFSAYCMLWGVLGFWKQLTPGGFIVYVFCAEHHLSPGSAMVGLCVK